jgi:hypothetical protein
MWKNSRMEGKGKHMNEATGDIYDGEFKNNLVCVFLFFFI